MELERFERYVMDAVAALPPDFLDRLENLEVVAEDAPDAEQLTSVGLGPQETLLGLYEGVPLTERTSYYGMVAPDKITIFRGPIEDCCRNDAEIIQQINETVYHEIAHHFGISDRRIEELQKHRRRRRI
jgi:predicted Zn-dependent protease with MMP-like domain